MFKIQKINPKLRIVFHGLGLSCLGAALFLQATVFSGILQNGYFRGAEGNTTILVSEIAMTGFAVVYFVYIYAKFILSHK